MANQVAYGFMSLKDLFARRVTEVGVDVIGDAVQQSLAEQNRQMASITSLFVQPTTDFKTRFRTPVIARLQPLDENGRARPIKLPGVYDVAFPKYPAGGAWGANYITMQKMRVEEANDLTVGLLAADVRWMRDHLLAALFANTSWTFTDDEHGALTIQGLANADTTTYYLTSGADAGATDTHYLAQAAGIADATNPYPAIYAELAEHPENGGQVIALVPTNLMATTQALALYRPVMDPNVTLGANTVALTGNLGVSVPGILRGYVEKVWIVEWPQLPDNYIVAVTENGVAPLKMREEPEPELRGFRAVAERDDHPWYERQYLRIAGFGAWNRVGAVVQRIGNGSYAVPTGYTSPMA